MSAQKTTFSLLHETMRAVPVPRRSGRARSLAHTGSHRRPTAGLVLTGFTLAMSVLFGGGAAPGLVSDAVLELASLPLLGFAIVSLVARPLARGAGLPIIVICAAVVLIALQLFPLPPSFWSVLPGRNQFAQTYLDAGMAAPWLPISLDPLATWRSGLALLPGVAVFLGVLSLDSGQRRQLALLLVGLTFVSVVLGLAQLMQGPASALRPYAPRTSAEHAVGFFANRNQFAGLLYSAMPLAAACAAGLVAEHRTRKAFAVLMCLLAYAIFVVGLVTAISRAGLILGFAAGMGSFAMLWSSGVFQSDVRDRSRMVVAAVAISAVLVIHISLLVALGNRETLTDEGRFLIYRITAHAAQVFFPVGSGFGTFVPVYGMHETPETVSVSYTNHAHNDWLELWLEGGVPALVLVCAFLVWFIRRFPIVWRSGADEPQFRDLFLPRAGWLVVLFLLLHSAVDYPLRTGTNLSVFAFACALLIPSSARSTTVGRSRSDRRSAGAIRAAPHLRSSG